MDNNSLEIVQIELNRIVPNDYNPNAVPVEVMAKLRAEIAQKGLCEPIIVRSRGDGYVIVDGFHRWQICRDLGYTEIPCIIQGYDENEAKIKTLQLNYMRGSVVPIKLASLIHDLSKEIKLEDLAKRLPYEELQLDDALELLKLPENLKETIEENARMEEEQLPSVVSFVLHKNQVEVVEKALQIASQDMPEGAKNIKALALEKICALFVEANDDTKAEAVSKT